MDTSPSTNHHQNSVTKSSKSYKPSPDRTAIIHTGQCPFCNLDKEKSRVLKITKTVFVILSNPRLMPGHLLVIPRRHVEKLAELTLNESNDLLKMIIEFQEKLLSKYSSGCDIRQHYRPFQKQDTLKVNHLHVHLQPREFEDQLYRKCQIYEKPFFRNLSRREAEKFHKLLRDAKTLT